MCVLFFFFSICRKAISRSGLQHLAPVHSLNIPVTNGPVKEPRAALEWTVGVWFLTINLSSICSWCSLHP